MKVLVLLLLAVSLVSAKPKPRPQSEQQYDPQQDLTKVFNFAPSLETGVQTAIDERKPIMLIVHATYCSACKKLIPDMVASSDLKKMSKDFVVIHSVDGSEPIAETIGPDGSYFPRIVFFGSNAQILPQVNNPKQPKYLYYYEKAADVAKSMKNALRLNINAIKANVA